MPAPAPLSRNLQVWSLRVLWLSHAHCHSWSSCGPTRRERALWTRIYLRVTAAYRSRRPEVRTGAKVARYQVDTKGRLSAPGVIIMDNARKGLKRHGLRSYIVDGTRPMIIERERPRRFKVRPADWQPSFHFDVFRRLRDARVAAEGWAGLIDDFPDPSMPKFLRRYVPAKRGSP